MSIDIFKTDLQEFCNKNGFKINELIPIGKSYLVLISGDNCLKPFDKWLGEIGIKSHTTPRLFDMAIGSYIEL